SAVCGASDSVTVDVASAPLLSCADGKPTALVFEYLGGGCNGNTPNNTQEGKFSCSGAAAANKPVRLVVEGANVTPAGQVINVGDTFRIEASNGKFNAQTGFLVIQDGKTVQILSLHLSCSKPLNVG